MRNSVRHNILVNYSLHDMAVTSFEIRDDRMILRSQSGMMRIGQPCRQVDGFVEFEDVRWDFSYVYLLDHVGNTGRFSGEKLLLREFLERYPAFTFSILDETYGFNMTKYTGLFSAGEKFCEMQLEITHEGDMIFVETTEYAGMMDVILSHDGEAILCRVPSEVAQNLDSFCLDFASSWVWHGPENGWFLRSFGEEQVGAIFGTADFIDYLNRWIYPEEDSRIVKGLGCFADELPEAYTHLPRYNF